MIASEVHRVCRTRSRTLRRHQPLRELADSRRVIDEICEWIDERRRLMIRRLRVCGGIGSGVGKRSLRLAAVARTLRRRSGGCGSGLSAWRFHFHFALGVQRDLGAAEQHDFWRKRDFQRRLRNDGNRLLGEPSAIINRTSVKF